MSKLRFSAEWVLCVFVPCAFFALSVYIERVMGYRCFTACEDGPVEYVQALVCFMAFVVGAIFWIKTKAYPLWMRAFFLLGVVGALYAALEEISYGQRIFGWMTPESWGLVNDQDETNLHNASSWLDQKPRLILFIGSIVGGLMIPALRRWKPALLPQKFAALYPSNGVVITAAFSLFVYVFRGVTEALGKPELFMIERGSEAQEIYLYWFVFLYFWLKNREITVSATHGR